MSLSWLWGGNNKPQLPTSFSDYVPPNAGGAADAGGAAGGSGGGDKDKKDGAMSAYRFDSTALERAAAAAKELEKNPHAEKFLELSREQEKTKQNEYQIAMKQLELQARQTEAQTEEKRMEERRRAMREKMQEDRERLKIEDQMARARYDDGLAKQRALNEEKLKREEEAVRKQEEIKLAALDAKMRKKMELEKERVQHEVFAKAKMDRENQDLTLEQIRTKAREDRETKLESIKSIGALVGSGMYSFLGDQQRFSMAVGGLVALTAGYFTAKGSLGIAFRFLEARLVKPSLVRETSRLSLMETFKHPIETIKKIKWRMGGSQDALQGVILKPNVEAAIRDIALETKNCRQAKGIYRNVLLHGPPGTGKTLFAMKLARNSGMDYALMTGGDVQLMGNQSVEAIHKLFDWARTSRRGLILFIDEADSFLIERHANMSQQLRDTMAAFLSRTGDHNDRFMMILTSNIPSMFDEAVISRIHDAVEFGLPGLSERTQLVGHYFQKYILEPASTGKWRIKLDESNWTEVCKEVASLTEGMSGREIAHLALDWQMKTIVTEKGELTRELMIERTKVAMERKAKTLLWKKAKQSEDSRFRHFTVPVGGPPQHGSDSTACPIPSTS